MKFVYVEKVSNLRTISSSLFLKERQIFMNKIRDIDSSLTNQNESLSFMHFFLVKRT